MRRRRPGWSGEAGAELIEMALTLPLILLVLLGLSDFGFLFQKYKVINNSAREGVRYATANPNTPTVDVQNRGSELHTGVGATDECRKPDDRRDPHDADLGSRNVAGAAGGRVLLPRLHLLGPHGELVWGKLHVGNAERTSHDACRVQCHRPTVNGRHLTVTDEGST